MSFNQERIAAIGFLQEEGMFSDPFLARNLVREEQSKKNGNLIRIKSPDQVLGEQRSLAFMSVLPDMKFYPKASPMERRGIYYAIRNAIPYLWLDDVTELIKNTSIAEDVTFQPSMLPFPTCFFTFEVNQLYPTGKLRSLMAMLLLKERLENRLAIVWIGHSGVGFDMETPIARLTHVPYGVSLKRLGCGTRSMLASIAKMLTFIGSPYLQTVEQRASRSARREDARKSGVEPAAVRFIDLRRIEPDDSKNRDRSREDCERDFRWIVSGHIRNQWYPSADEHRPIFIAPHLKGPEGFPVRPRLYRVCR